MEFLSARDVAAIHELVIEPHELQGTAHNKSLDSVIARIDNRIAYGIITDEFELAACYACYIAVGHVFNDANKRTAFTSMMTTLSSNNIELSLDYQEAGNMIIKAAQGIVDEAELAEWLRSKT